MIEKVRVTAMGSSFRMFGNLRAPLAGGVGARKVQGAGLLYAA